MDNIYIKHDVKVFDKFIDKFARKYIEQRSASKLEILQAAESLGSDFDISQIKSIVERNSVYEDPYREKGQTPPVLNDIYRSDLGELLTTYYFEEKLGEKERYIIPAKNISIRERYDMPGRGIDAIGYKIKEDGTKELLVAEAKVSSQVSSPPAVVDSTGDSIYSTHKKYHDDSSILCQRLVEYSKHLKGTDLAAIFFFVLNIEKGNPIDITYGCGLVRDFNCVNESTDYGKMKSCETEFEPGQIHFTIFSFTEETIDSTIDLFYKKVRELAQ